MPPFSALTTETAVQKSSNDDPVLGSELMDLLNEEVVLLLAPLAAECELVALLSIRQYPVSVNMNWFIISVLNQDPSLKAPDFGFVRHELTQPVPAVFAVDLHQSSQFIVLYQTSHGHVVVTYLFWGPVDFFGRSFSNSTFLFLFLDFNLKFWF